MKTGRVVRGAAALAGICVVAAGGYVTVAWARYGHVHPGRHPDELLDRFLPNPEVDEYHTLKVRAPAEVTYPLARDMDLMQSPPVRAIFWLRAIPAMLRGEPYRREGPHGLLDETLAMGWGLLAATDRRIVVGAYTQPWHQDVSFHALPPEEFAGFNKPGYVKIVWTMGAEPLGANESMVVTRTRVTATDPESRTRFRRYWAPMSSGIILIRYLALPLVKAQAERNARIGATPAAEIGPTDRDSSA